MQPAQLNTAGLVVVWRPACLDKPKGGQWEEEEGKDSGVAWDQHSSWKRVLGSTSRVSCHRHEETEPHFPLPLSCR